MIKRQGTGIKNARGRNSSIAQETLSILKDREYTAPSGNVVKFHDEMKYAIDGTVLYDNPLPQVEMTYLPTNLTVEVINETTTSAAVRLSTLGKDNIVALNFASAKTPGGGFLAGALAQEEDLCRASGLYACIKSKPQYYNNNILRKDSLYNDDIIYSPQVPFFRNEYKLLLEKPYLLSIITAPAPNISFLKEQPKTSFLKELLQNRATKILQIAELNGHKNLILGAWGCGAFGNDPVMVAEAFQFALAKVPAFEHVCFAVYDTRDPTVLFNTFKEVFNG